MSASSSVPGGNPPSGSAPSGSASNDSTKKTKTPAEASKETRDLVNKIANIVGSVPSDLSTHVTFSGAADTPGESPFDKELKALKKVFEDKTKGNLEQKAILDFFDDRLKAVFEDIHNKALLGEPFDSAVWKKKIEDLIEHELRGYLESKGSLPSTPLATSQQELHDYLRDTESKFGMPAGTSGTSLTSRLDSVASQLNGAQDEYKAAKDLRSEGGQDQQNLSDLLIKVKKLAVDEAEVRTALYDPNSTVDRPAYLHRMQQYADPQYISRVSADVTLNEEEVKNSKADLLDLGRPPYPSVKGAKLAASQQEQKLNEAIAERDSLAPQLIAAQNELKASIPLAPTVNQRLKLAAAQDKIIQHQARVNEIAALQVTLDPLKVAISKYDRAKAALKSHKETKDDLKVISDLQDQVAQLSVLKGASVPGSPATLKGLPQSLKTAVDDMQLLSKQLRAAHNLPELKDPVNQTLFAENSLAPLAERILRHEFLRAKVPGVNDTSTLQQQVDGARKEYLPKVIDELKKIPSVDAELKDIQARETAATATGAVEVGGDSPQKRFEDLMALADRTHALDDEELHHLANCTRLALNIHQERTVAPAPLLDPRKVFVDQLEQLQTLSQEQFERQKNWHLAENEKTVDARLAAVKVKQETQVNNQQGLQTDLTQQVTNIKKQLTDDLAMVNERLKKLEEYKQNESAPHSGNYQQYQDFQAQEGILNTRKADLSFRISEIDRLHSQTTTASTALTDAHAKSQTTLQDLQKASTDMLNNTATQQFEYLTKHLHKQEAGIRTLMTRRQWGWGDHEHRYTCNMEDVKKLKLGEGREEYGLAGMSAKGVKFRPNLIYNDTMLDTSTGKTIKRRIYFSEEEVKGSGNLMVAKNLDSGRGIFAGTGGRLEKIFGSPSASNYNAFFQLDHEKFKHNKGAEIDFLMAAGATQLTLIPPPSSMKVIRSGDYGPHDKGDFYKKMSLTVDAVAAKQLNIHRADTRPSDAELKKDFKNSYLITGSSTIPYQLHYIDEKGKAHTSTLSSADLEAKFTDCDMLTRRGPWSRNMSHLTGPAKDHGGVQVQRLNLGVKQLDALTEMVDQDPSIPREKGTHKMIWQGGLDFGSPEKIDKMRTEIHALAAEGLLTLKQADKLVRKLDVFVRQKSPEKNLVKTAEEKMQAPIEHKEAPVSGSLVSVSPPPPTSAPLSSSRPNDSGLDLKHMPKAPILPGDEPKTSSRITDDSARRLGPADLKTALPPTSLPTSLPMALDSITTPASEITSLPQSAFAAMPDSTAKHSEAGEVKGTYKVKEDTTLGGQFAQIQSGEKACDYGIEKAIAEPSSITLSEVLNRGVVVVETVHELVEMQLEKETLQGNPLEVHSDTDAFQAGLLDQTTKFLVKLSEGIESIQKSLPRGSGDEASPEKEKLKTKTEALLNMLEVNKERYKSPQGVVQLNVPQLKIAVDTLKEELERKPGPHFTF